MITDMFDTLVEREGASLAIQVEQQGVSRDLQMVVKDELYVIGREAVRNAICHAQAGRIQVLLNYGAKDLLLEVSDDGSGMPPEMVASGRPGHLGLGAMQRRAEQIGGKCSIESRPGKTLVRVTVPARLAYRQSESAIS